ncbi:hypothetical protein [Chachezhania sediminis]|uniref:hypothetical protein n=1 Tax=Chachezhania sediminis TaxID=2599291 RepID=UPI00131D416F
MREHTDTPALQEQEQASLEPSAEVPWLADDLVLTLVSQTPTSVGFGCLVWKSTGDSIPLLECSRFALQNSSMYSNTSCLAAPRVG